MGKTYKSPKRKQELKIIRDRENEINKIVSTDEISIPSIQNLSRKQGGFINSR